MHLVWEQPFQNVISKTTSMIKKALLGLLFLSVFTAGSIFAQQAKVDSLENVLKLHTTEDTVKVNLLFEIAKQYQSNNVEKARAYAVQSGELSDRLNFPNGKAQSLRLIGNTYIRQGDTLALDYLQKSLKICEENNFKSQIIQCLNSIGVMYIHKGQIPKAIETLEKAIKVAEELNSKPDIRMIRLNIAALKSNTGKIDEAINEYINILKDIDEISDKELMYNVYNNLGFNYNIQGNYPLALENYQKCLKLAEESNDKEAILVVANNMSSIYSNQEDYTKALEYSEKSLALAEELNAKPRISNALRGIGLIYQKMKNPLALEYLQKSLEVSEEINQMSSIVGSLNYIGLYYIEIKEYDKALKVFQDALEKSEKIKLRAGIINSLNGLCSIHIKKKNYEKALNYALRNLELTKNMKSLTIKRDIHEMLARIYAATHDYKNAFHNHKLYKALNDSVYKDENIKRIVELEYTYKFEKEKQAIELEQQKKDAIQASQKRQQQIVKLSFIGAFILMSLLAFYIYRSYLDKKKSNIVLTKQKEEIEAKNKDLVQLNEEISAQGEEISSQRDEIEAQRDMVVIQKDRIQAQNKLITDSINYAKYIQQALLPSSEYAEANLGDHFILFKPKDIVSGDFYWSTRVNEFLIVTVADCTGHGIPGAFMSILGISFLNEIVGKKGVVKASEILDQLRSSVIDALKQKMKTGEQKDGMDLALVVINTKTGQLQYAGAHNPLYIVTAGKELKQLKSDNQTVAINIKMNPFTNQEIQLNKGDSIYLTSDGYHDQFGGPQNTKFKRTQLKELLVAIAHKPMAEQGELLDSTFKHWKGEHEQIDDVTIVGMKF
jgi:serine phosphatase RsbU (regulator of sigma subunit)